MQLWFTGLGFVSGTRHITTTLNAFPSAHLHPQALINAEVLPSVCCEHWDVCPGPLSWAEAQESFLASAGNAHARALV